MNINLYNEKQCCGAVGYITENIPIVLGSVLGCATFFFSFIITIKSKVLVVYESN